MGGLVGGRSIGFHQEKTGRIFGLLEELEPGYPGLLNAVARVFHCGRLERLDGFGLYPHVNMNDVHGAPIGGPAPAVKIDSIFKEDKKW